MKPTGNSAHARCQKGGVPEEAEIYLQLIHFKKVWGHGQFRPPQGALLFGSAHGRCYL